MSKETHLVQKAKTGKTKHLILSTKGKVFWAEWYTDDAGKESKHQTSPKVCVPKNVGRSNATTAEQQAIVELEAKVALKMKEGYVLEGTSALETVETREIDLNNIPKEFCPSKPISKCPQKIVDDAKTYGQRKFNGHCVILVRGDTSFSIYSRRMEDRTKYLSGIPIFTKLLMKLPVNTFLLTEVTYTPNDTGKESPRQVAKVIRVDDADEATTRYKELSKNGKFECIPFDALWIAGEYVGDTDYITRAHKLKDAGIKVPTIYKEWKNMLESAEADGWEGFVLRVPGEKSYIGYTLDGKAARKGCWKYKFTQTDDFVITECIKGISGKHKDMYAKFKIGQYNSEGELLDLGYVGPGTLTHDELKELTKSWDGKPFVVEIEFADFTDSDKPKVQFGVIQRMRPDKQPDECTMED